MKWIIFYNFITKNGVFEVEKVDSSFVNNHSGEYYFFNSKEKAIKKCKELNTNNSNNRL